MKWFLLVLGLAGTGLLRPAWADDEFLRQKAFQALDECRISQAQSLRDEIADPESREELTTRLQQALRAQERVNGLFKQANQAYSQCDYVGAATLLEQAIYSPGCRRIRQQLSDKLQAILQAAYQDYETNYRWSDLRHQANRARESYVLKDLQRAVSRIAELKGQAHCPALNQRIDDFHAQLDSEYNQLEFADRPYAGVRQALKQCRYETAAELMQKIESGPRKDRLQQELDTMIALRAETNHAYAEARQAYVACDYSRALSVLQSLRDKSLCGKIVVQLDAKIGRTKAMLRRDEKVRDLLREVQSDPQMDLAEAYRKLSLAQQMNQCGVRRGNLGLILDKARSRLPVETQVTTYDCRTQPNTESYWNAERGRPDCRCTKGYHREEGGECVANAATQVSVLNCSPWPHSEARWFDVAEEPACFCADGYRWKPDYTSCVPIEGQ